MRFAKIILVYLAGTILLLHTLVPHAHIEDIDNVKDVPRIETASSFLDYVRILFLTDLGDGHLDHFGVDDGPSTESDAIDFLDLTAVVFAALKSLESNKNIDREIVYFSDPDPPDIYLNTNLLRGPPTSC